MKSEPGDRCIRHWLAADIPQALWPSTPFEPESGVTVAFLAHLPQIVNESDAYGKIEAIFAGEFDSNSWMRAGELVLSGTNALNFVPHPDDDGILLIGSCV